MARRSLRPGAPPAPGEPPEPGSHRHAWLQKHPSPLTSAGEFHWYPEVAQAGDRELRTGFVERARGVEPPAVLWQLEPGRAAWGQVFSAIAPVDGRRYVGVVLSAVEGERPVADLLASLVPPPAAPWDGGASTTTRGSELAAQDVAAVRREARGDVAGVVRALLSGGTARVESPESARLPAWIASIERMLPEPGPRPRSGMLSSAAASRSGDRVAELAGAAWREPASRQARAWTLLCELASARGESVDDVGAALDAVEAGAVLSAEERTLVALDRRDSSRGATVLEVLHAWGRGRLDASPSAGTLAARLADLVALRVLLRLAAGEDPGAAVAEARWHALVPAARRTMLLDAVARRTASLRAIVEGHDA